MQNNLGNPKPMLQSADSRESADYAKHNRPQLTFEQLSAKSKQHETQRRGYEKIEKQEHEKADIALENELKEVDEKFISKQDIASFLLMNYPNNEKAKSLSLKYLSVQNALGINVSKKELKDFIFDNLKEKKDLSTADQIINFKDQLTQQGKSSKEIIQTLIAKYENEEAVSTWVENWKSFLKLYQYAKGKSPQEQKAIQHIIASADFTAENSFETALLEIHNSTEISTKTKTDLQHKFGAANISSVSEMDNALSQIKKQKKEVEKRIGKKEKENESLKVEILDIEEKLNSLPLDDPKREELKTTLKLKQDAISQKQSEIKTLKADKPKRISFSLRKSFEAQQNSNGSRSILLGESNFEVLLPDNALFMSRKNTISINLCFTFNTFNQLGMDALFSPKLKNGEVPDKKQRLFSNQILKQLGYPTDQILSQSNIYQLEKDLSKLKHQGSSSTGVEDLEELGIMNVKQELNSSRLEACLKFIRKNRGRQIGFEDVR